jgi:hypothetical protein
MKSSLADASTTLGSTFEGAVAQLQVDAKFLEDFAYRNNILPSANDGLAALFQVLSKPCASVRGAGGIDPFCARIVPCCNVPCSSWRSCYLPNNQTSSCIALTLTQHCTRSYP